MSPPPEETQRSDKPQFQFDFPPNALRGKVVLVAGGSGGLGSATAILLAREGAHLVIGYRSNRARAEALQKALESVQARVELVRGDLNRAGVPEEYIRCATALGPLTAVAIFAGDPARPTATAPLREAERMEASWKANFLGPYRLAQHAAQQMADQGTPGSIVLISTMQAVAPFEQSSVYAAPKAALTHAARILAHEFGGRRNISVNVVAPGVTVAGMAAASVASGKYERFVRDDIISRYGRAEDVARAVRLLLEPDGYITGQAITVDGGLTLRR